MASASVSPPLLTVNEGAKLARGDLISVVNADDPCLPGLVRAAVDAFAEDPELLAVYPDWRMIDREGRTIENVVAREFDYALMVEQVYCIPGPGAVLRKSGLAGEPLRDPRYPYASDYELWLRLGALNSWRPIRFHAADPAHYGRSRPLEV